MSLRSVLRIVILLLVLSIPLSYVGGMSTGLVLTYETSHGHFPSYIDEAEIPRDPRIRGRQPGSNRLSDRTDQIPEWSRRVWNPCPEGVILRGDPGQAQPELKVVSSYGRVPHLPAVDSGRAFRDSACAPAFRSSAACGCFAAPVSQSFALRSL